VLGTMPIESLGQKPF